MRAARPTAGRAVTNGLALGLALTLGVGACATSEPQRGEPPVAAPLAPPQPAALLAGVERGAEYLVEHQDEMDPISLIIVDAIYRRWGIPSLRGARAAAERLVLAGEGRGGSEVLDQLVIPTLPPPAPDVWARSGQTDQVILRAARCQLGEDAVSLFADLSALRYMDPGPDGPAPEYFTTHVGLAIGVYRQAGCVDPDGGALRTEVIDAIVADLEDARPIGDLQLEQGITLDMLDAWDRVPEGFVGRALDAQRRDGGWPIGAGERSDWHATFLGVWVLARANGPGNDEPFSLYP